MISNLLMALALAATTAPPAPPQDNAARVTLAPAARPAAAIVDRFHAALARGDTAGALALLSDDVLIYESGRAERSKAEYAAHHLAADAAFSQAVPSRLIRRTGQVSANHAWIASEGRTAGRFRGRAVDRTTKETMVLRRTAGAWRIVHVHWSSADAK